MFKETWPFSNDIFKPYVSNRAQRRERRAYRQRGVGITKPVAAGAVSKAKRAARKAQRRAQA